MNNRIDNALIINLNIQLFATFTRQGLFWSLAFLYLAAHELPKPALRFVRRSLSDKIPVAIFYDSANYLNYLTLAHPASNARCFSNNTCDGKNLTGMIIFFPSRLIKYVFAAELV